MSLMLTKQLETGDFAELLSELTWTGKQYVGTQRAVARITGLAQSGIRKGLGCDQECAPDEPKMLKWLAAQGIKPHTIQKEWQAGSVKDAPPTPSPIPWLPSPRPAGPRGRHHGCSGRSCCASCVPAAARLPAEGRRHQLAAEP